MRKIVSGAVVTMSLLGLSTLASATTRPGPPNPQSAVSAGANSTITAVAALDELKVRGRAPKTAYDRARFGTAWADTDRNGCDTRNDVLRRDLTSITVRASGCVVLTGTLSDPTAVRASRSPAAPRRRPPFR